LQAKVYFFIVTHFFDKPVNFLTDFQRLKHFVFIQDALVVPLMTAINPISVRSEMSSATFLALMKTGLFFIGPTFFMFS
jgi:hypothetical protein